MADTGTGDALPLLAFTLSQLAEGLTRGDTLSIDKYDRLGGETLDAATVVAICVTVVAIASLAVSVYEGRAARRHNRYSVRPLLELDTSFRPGRRADLRLTNSGLGPAAVTRTVLKVRRRGARRVGRAGCRQDA